MRIVEVIAEADFTLRVTPDNGRVGTVDVRPFLRFEAFEPLKDPEEFVRVRNGGYFIEWDCGADLSADSIEAHMRYLVSQ